MAEVMAVTYGTARPYTKELYTAVPYYTVRYGFGRILTGYGRSLGNMFNLQHNTDILVWQAKNLPNGWRIEYTFHF